MLGIVLLTIGIIGLVLTVLSLVGLEIDSAVDLGFDLGDSGVGLLSLLTPFVTGFGHRRGTDRNGGTADLDHRRCGLCAG